LEFRRVLFRSFYLLFYRLSTFSFTVIYWHLSFTNFAVNKKGSRSFLFLSNIRINGHYCLLAPYFHQFLMDLPMHSTACPYRAGLPILQQPKSPKSYPPDWSRHALLT